MDKNSFAITPPMGWNSYDYYDTTVTEDQVKKNADFMAANLKQYGWQYIVVDIEWYSNDAGTRREQFQYIPFGDDEIDEYGRFIPSPSRFPSSVGGAGFKPLADYCHELGLKFGIHIMRGIPRAAAERHLPILGTDYSAADAANPSSICGWNPDMYGCLDNDVGQAYYDSIVKLYAEWGVDFIKCDDICDSWMYKPEDFSGWHETRMLHDAIKKSGREIVLSLSPGPAHIDKAFHYQKYANMWRITDDFWDKWELLKNMFFRCEQWQDHVRAGCFPDCDMLPIGKVGAGFKESRDSRFTQDELKTMMTLWCIFRSPLMIGGELTLMTEDNLKLLTNKNLLQLLEDGWKAQQIMRDDNQAIWISKNERFGRRAAAFFNLSEDSSKVLVEQAVLPNEETVTATDIWTDTDVSLSVGSGIEVPAHGVKLYIY
ncbi:glycoside hydrolase family 27 protein [Pseudobutyrivibrio xylanivorans]|uniref:Alpha-galactosidase n=1 Tax=Pseudobutyrivibrio xylanivorans TaxID=185007 RepID=A0A5P6VLV2_PSEXY|nr:glycoside hydrolase family 27 protein [Pseudobutyrivibrio xylanivorans]QFJ53547.1 glycoside hydrolase family 27 [Pseudobutyrivibrio xylanivorans]